MSHSPAHAPVWNRDIRRNSAPCFSKIVFACLAVLTISSGLSLLKRGNCVIDIRGYSLGWFACCPLNERSQGTLARALRSSLRLHKRGTESGCPEYPQCHPLLRCKFKTCHRAVVRLSIDFKLLSQTVCPPKRRNHSPNCLVTVVALFVAIVRCPLHSLWLRRQIPFISFNTALNPFACPQPYS